MTQDVAQQKPTAPAESQAKKRSKPLEKLNESWRDILAVWPLSLLLSATAVLLAILLGALPLLIADYLMWDWLVGPGLIWALGIYSAAAWALSRWPIDATLRKNWQARKGDAKKGPPKKPDA